MPEYTFLRVDRDDRIVERIERTCADEVAAIKFAAALAGEGVVEVWEGPQKIVAIGSHTPRRS